MVFLCPSSTVRRHTRRMRYLPYDHQRNVSLARTLSATVWHCTARTLSPIALRAVAVSRSPRARQAVTVLLLLLGLVVQLVLLLVAGYLIDLSISLMDLWLELARKHLELTL